MKFRLVTDVKHSSEFKSNLQYQKYLDDCKATLKDQAANLLKSRLTFSQKEGEFNSAQICWEL